MPSKNNNCVYMHVRSDNDEPMYIGISNNPHRPYTMHPSARNEYHIRSAKAHGMRVIILHSGLTREQACFWEKACITALRNAGYNLTNLTDGGEGTIGSPSHNRRKVLCLETGDVFNSASAAAKKFGVSQSSVSNVCNWVTHTCKGLHFIWFKVELDEASRNTMIWSMDASVIASRKRLEICDESKGVVDGKNCKGIVANGPMKNAKRVISVTDGIEFPSIKAAARHYNVNHIGISELCHGKKFRKKVGGIEFKFAE